MELIKKGSQLAEEIKIIDDYISLEKLRYNERLSANFEKKADNLQQLKAPLLLLPLVEKAFKYGAIETRFESLYT